MAKFEPGNKHGKGRPAGALNKTTAELRTLIEDFLNSDLERAWKDFDKMKPFERWKVRIGLMDFCLPKLRTVELEGDLFKLSDDQAERILNELKREVIKKQYKNRLAK